jgi:HEAT repeat protein
VKKRGIKAPLVLLAVVLGGLSFAHFLRSGEPVYDGKPLGYWLKGYDPVEGSEPARQKADEILQQAGTNAIPTLLRLLRKTDSPFKLKIISLAQKQRFIKTGHIDASLLNFEAATAFESLGPRAKSAVPELIKIRNAEQIDSPGLIANVLGFIGPAARAAVPMLMRDAADTNLFTRESAVIALVRIRGEPKLVVPVLIDCLQTSGLPGSNWTNGVPVWEWRGDPAPNLQAIGAWGLEQYGKDAVPILRELARSAERAVRNKAEKALAQLEGETSARLPGGDGTPGK